MSSPNHAILESVGIAPLLYDLERWSEEIHIKYDLDYKWTGIVKYKDGYATNWQSPSLGELILYFWERGKERIKPGDPYPKK